MKYTALRDVCEINMGQSPDSSSYNEEGRGIPFFQGNADFGERNPVTRVWCDAPSKIANANDILISVRAPIGAVNYAAETCCIGRGLAAITPDLNRVSSEYIFWLLKGKNAELNSKGTGSTFKAINRKALEEIQVPDVSLKEQAAHAANLETAYMIIQMRKQQLSTLDDLIKARFVEMFGDLRSNPRGWPVYCFEDITEIITDGEHATPRRVDQGIYLLSARNVLDHALQLDDVDSIDQDEYDRIAKRIVPQAGDVLISCSGSVGRCCTVPEGLKFQMVRSAALLRFDKRVLPVYAEYMITSDDLQDQINSSKTASSQANLFQGKIAKLKGFVPPIAQQEQFVAFVSQIDKSKSVIQKSLDETQLLFDSLMQEYFG